MSTSRPFLFASREFGGDSVAASLFAEGFIPQTYSLTLTESMSETDADLFSTIKRLSDTVTLTEAQTKALTKVLTDSVTSSSAIANTLTKVLAETGRVSDSTKLVFTIKTLSDFLILKEWISIRLTKALVWTNPSVNANLHDFLFGTYTFGSQLFGGVKPSSSWTKGTRGPNVWTNTDGSKYNY